MASSTTLAAKIAAAALALLAASVIVLDEAGVRSFHPVLRAAAGLTAAGVAFLATAAAAIHEYRGRGALDRRERLGYALRQLAFTIAETADIDVRELGLAVYVVRRDWSLPWRRLLLRAARERSVHRPSASSVVWRPGKGVIGRCVALGGDVAQDVGADTAPWQDATEEDWNLRVPEDVKGGFTYEEFLAMRGRYHVVIATPILDDVGPRTRVVGCLALDGPSGSFDDLAADDVRAAMARVAPTIGALLR